MRNARRASEELLALVEEFELPARFTAIAHLARFTCAYEIGDVSIAEKHIAHAGAEVDASRTPEMRAQVLWSEASISILRGDYDTAEKQADEMHAAFRTTRSFVADVCRGALLGQIETERGNGEAAVQLTAVAVDTPYAGTIQWYAAWVLAEAGRLGDAAAMLAAFDGDLPDDWYTMFVRVAGLHAAVKVGDKERITTIAEVLTPLSGFLACNGSGGPVLGPIDLALAAAAHALGDDDRARDLLATALEMAERMGAKPWIARCLELSAVLDGEDPNFGNKRAP